MTIKFEDQQPQEPLDPQLPLTVIDAKERHRRIREESDRLEKEKAEQQAEQQTRDGERHKVAVAEAIERENKFIDNVALVSGAETREALYARIKAIRNEKPANAPVEYPVLPLTPRMQKQLEEEQAAGRRAVERATLLQEQQRVARAKYDLEEQMKNSGTPVHVPNPGMDAVFPTNKR